MTVCSLTNITCWQWVVHPSSGPVTFTEGGSNKLRLLTGIIDYCVCVLGKSGLKAWQVLSWTVSPRYYHNSIGTTLQTICFSFKLLVGCGGWLSTPQVVSVGRLYRECINSGMDYWNGGIVEWWNVNFLKLIIKFYIQIRHESLTGSCRSPNRQLQIIYTTAMYLMKSVSTQ